MILHLELWQVGILGAVPLLLCALVIALMKRIRQITPDPPEIRAAKVFKKAEARIMAGGADMPKEINLNPPGTPTINFPGFTE